MNLSISATESIFGEIQGYSFKEIDSRLRESFMSQKGENNVTTFFSMHNKDSGLIKKDGSLLGALTDDELSELNEKRRTELARIQEQKRQEEEIRNTVPRTEITSAWDRFVGNAYDDDGENVSYRIDGVDFSGTDTKKIKSMFNACLSSLSSKTALDYGDYARMGMVSAFMKQYGLKNLNTDQADVVNKFVSEYLEKKVSDQDEWLASSNMTTDDTEWGLYGNFHEYYNRFTNSEKDRLMATSTIEFLKNHPERKDLSEKFRQETISHYETALTGGKFWQSSSASNMELANELRTLFADTDYADENAISRSMDKYKELMRPVVSLYGLNVEQDLSLYVDSWKKTFTNLKKIISDSRHESVNLEV